MPITKDALERLRNHYNANKGSLPSQQKIADLAGVSESTVQRALTGPADKIKFETIIRIAPVIGISTEELGISGESLEALDNKDLQALVIAMRDMNLRELAAQREADDARWRERLNADLEKHRHQVEVLTQEHAADMRRIRDEHSDEMKRSNAAHDAHVVQIHQMYDRQMESMRQANAKQMELMLDGHARQIEAVQKVDQAQQEAVQRMANAQMEADEKSKDFLKREISQRDSRLISLDKRDKVKNAIIFSLIAMIFLLFFFDFMMPQAGWIRRITGALFSYHHFG